MVAAKRVRCEEDRVKQLEDALRGALVCIGQNIDGPGTEFEWNGDYRSVEYWAGEWEKVLGSKEHRR